MSSSASVGVGGQPRGLRLGAIPLGRRIARPFRPVRGPHAPRPLASARDPALDSHRPSTEPQSCLRNVAAGTALGVAAMVAILLRPPLAQCAAEPQHRGPTATLCSGRVEPESPERRAWQETGILLAASDGRVSTREGSGRNSSSKRKASQREDKPDFKEPTLEELQEENLIHLPDIPPLEKGAHLNRGTLSKDKVKWRPFDELFEKTEAAMERTADRRNLAVYKRQNLDVPGDKLVKNPRTSLSPPLFWNPDNVKFKETPATAWRQDKLINLTYTQFWNLVRERAVVKAKYTDDRRSLIVTLNSHAPGGARTEKVAIPFDPDLFDHLLEHGVFIEYDKPNPFNPIFHSLARLVFPISFSMWLVKFTFRLGRKKKRDNIFGGINMQVIKPGQAPYDFKDIAGIDTIKEEIKEVVEFLRNPGKFLEMGARSPAGVLLVGPPGTGKTLLAKAVAGEAKVPFFSVSGTEFMEMYAGIGASRVRDMFQQARASAPCILFIDEFDGVGKARSMNAGNEESVHTINQLLSELDGFDDNTGVVVFAASNRPQLLDSALTRPGRFDRIITLPYPNLDGRIQVLKVHARGKRVSPDLDYRKIARATAGYSGARLMNLMNNAAIVAARQGRVEITDTEVFDALERIGRDEAGDGGVEYDATEVPPGMRSCIAVYEAARALVGYITPNFDEVQRISVCPGGTASGSTYFLPLEEQLETRVADRGYLEAKMVVALAGRCAERLVLGEAHHSTSSGADLLHANAIAREMVYRGGYGQRMGPVALQDDDENFLNRERALPIANISTELSLVAFQDVTDLLTAAEAKAYWGLVKNYDALHALVDELQKKDTLMGPEISAVLDAKPLVKFPHRSLTGFCWREDGSLGHPGARGQKHAGKLERVGVTRDGMEVMGQPFSASSSSDNGNDNGNGNGSDKAHVRDWWVPGNPYTIRNDIARLLLRD